MKSQRCTAQSKQAHRQCKNSALLGAVVCRFHGGLSPQVQKKAIDPLTLAQAEAAMRRAQVRLRIASLRRRKGKPRP